MFLRHFYDVHLSPTKLALASGQTLYQYTLNIRRFDEFIESEVNKLEPEKRAEELSRRGLTAIDQFQSEVEDLTDQKIGQACQWLMAKKKLSIASASKLRENLVTLWKQAFALQLLRTLPVIPHIREPRRIPRAWRREQLRVLWGYLLRLPGYIGEIPENVYFTSLVATLWDTAERIGAIRQVEWSQLDLEDGWITVRAEQRKGHKSDRLYKLRNETIAILKTLRRESPKQGLVWPWPYADTYLWQRWKLLLRRAGLPSGRDFAFHCFRKSAATWITVAGGDAQRALDHQSPTTTNVTYIDPRIATPPQTIDFLFPLGDAG